MLEGGPPEPPASEWAQEHQEEAEEPIVVVLGIMLLDYSVALPALPVADSKQRADDQWVGG